MKEILWALTLVLAFLVPGREATLPGPAPSGDIVKPNADFYVLDAAGVLTRETEAYIVSTNDWLYEACGAQIVFVTVDTTGPIKPADYVYQLFNAWGVGSKEKNNGVVVLLAIQDDTYQYLQGTGLITSLPSNTMGELANEYLEPWFAAKDYDTGVRQFFDALVDEVSEIYKDEFAPFDATQGAVYVGEYSRKSPGRRAGFGLIKRCCGRIKRPLMGQECICVSA